MNSRDIIAATTGVTKKWAKQRRAEERQANRYFNRRHVMSRSCRVTIKEVAWQVMPQAYLKASSGGQYPAHARQIMYAARPEILAKADNCSSLNDAYFTQQLLPDFMQEHPDLTAAWDVVFDARGHLYEPHTDKEVALGTLDVRAYLKKITHHTVREVIADIGGNGLFPTMGPANRYSAILFIEKEGFMPLFRAARIAEKYDIAIMSTKGISTTAARLLVDELCKGGVLLLVLHDFDKGGFSILGTLTRDTRRYAFSHDINVIDLGLRLADIQEYDLASEQCTYGKTDPYYNLEENGATDAEIEFLRSVPYWRGDCYRGQRVELNAFTSGDFVKWIESKLQAQGVQKVIPDGETLSTAYRRAALVHILNEQIESLLEDAHSEADALPLDARRLAQQVKKSLRQRPEKSWDQVITSMVETRHERRAR